MTLYIHIPFCSSKCGYCTFNSYAKQDHLKAYYIQSLLKDLAYQLKQNQEKITSIFFGGGTPNSIDAIFYERIFETIYKNATLDKSCEITAEANPDLITLSWCENLKKLGLNRISIGVQSFFQDKLIFLQRSHNYKEIAQKIDLVAKSGIENISIDLIYDTPQDNPRRIQKEIKQASNLPINHISAYSLSIEEGSTLYKIHQSNPQQNSFFEEIRENLKNHHFLQYEVSNYSRGYKVSHNLSYWSGDQYIGCGAGGIGRIKDYRLYPHSNISNYIKEPLKRKKEFLHQKDFRTESIFLGLRCELGVKLDLLDEKKVKILVNEKKCYIKNNHLIAKDYFLADEIALWLL